MPLYQILKLCYVINTVNFTEKFNRQGKLGFGAPTKRISPRNSTDKASWGSGPQQKEFHLEIQQTRQVGVRWWTRNLRCILFYSLNLNKVRNFVTYF